MVCPGCLLAECAGMDCPDLAGTDKKLEAAQAVYIQIKDSLPNLKGVATSNLKQTKGV